MELPQDVPHDGRPVHGVEPADEVGVVGLQGLVEDAHSERHLGHDEHVGQGQAVPDKEVSAPEVVVEAFTAGVEASQAVLGVLADGLVAADEGQDHAAD